MRNSQAVLIAALLTCFSSVTRPAAAATLPFSPTTASMERAMSERRFATQDLPFVGAAARAHLRGPAARRSSKLVVTVPLGGDVAAAAGAVDEAGGGTVQLLAGTYHLTSSIPLDNDLTINGKGASTVILSPATPHGFAMMANVTEGIGNIVISNLVMDGNIPPGAFGPSTYGGAGIYIVALNQTIAPVTISNVEVRNTSIGLILDGVDIINLDNDYIHDNNPGGFSHNAYLIGCTDVNISHSRFDRAHTGDGLHFDFGSSLFTISKSEFSGNNGLGILDQGGSSETVTDTIANGNQNDGFNFTSSGSDYQRDLASNNWAFGYDNGGGSGAAYNLAGFGDGSGFGQFFAFGFGNLLLSTTANQYLAIMGTGPLGVTDTADWTTAYPGYSTIGAVDFNARHLSGGALSFDVGAVGAKNYGAAFRYSNGSSSTLSMPLSVNGASIGSASFPPTGSWSTWATTQVTLPLKDGNNVVRLTAKAPAAPELDYLQVNASVPAPPATPAGLTAVAKTPYQVYLAWKPVPGAQSYTVYRAGLPVALANGVLTTNYTDTTILSGDSTYTYVVAANNQGGSSPGTAGVTVTTPLDAPAGLQVSVETTGNVLNWLSADGATSYTVYRSTSNGGPYQAIATATGTTYTDSAAAAGFSYYYAVASANASGRSKLSYQLGVNAPATGQLSQDVGKVGVQGLTDYDATNGGFGIVGSGAGLWGTADGFHFEYLPIAGNVTLTARVSLVQAIAAGTQAGIDVRSSLAPGAPQVFVGLTGSLGAESVVRKTANAAAALNGHVAHIAAPYWVRLTRSGNAFTSAISPDGMKWTNIGTATVTMPVDVYAGLAGSSTVPSELALGLFDSVTTTGTLVPSAMPMQGAARAFGVRRPGHAPSVAI